MPSKLYYVPLPACSLGAIIYYTCWHGTSGEASTNLLWIVEVQCWNRSVSFPLILSNGSTSSHFSILDLVAVPESTRDFRVCSPSSSVNRLTNIHHRAPYTSCIGLVHSTSRMKGKSASSLLPRAFVSSKSKTLVNHRNFFPFSFLKSRTRFFLTAFLDPYCTIPNHFING